MIDRIDYLRFFSLSLLSYKIRPFIHFKVNDNNKYQIFYCPFIVLLFAGLAFFCSSSPCDYHLYLALDNVNVVLISGFFSSSHYSREVRARAREREKKKTTRLEKYFSYKHLASLLLLVHLVRYSKGACCCCYSSILDERERFLYIEAFPMESDNANGEVFLFTSESVGEGHPGKQLTLKYSRE